VPATHKPARVSVCIPTIDRPDYLREAIQSVADQTWTDLEIVLADNSGDLAAQRRIDRVLAEFPRLSFVLRRHQARLDAADNFNSLIDAARGEFLAWLPDDDRFCPGFIARSVAALDVHPECAFTFADHWIIDAEGKRDEVESEVNSVRFNRHLLREGVYHHDRLFGIALKQSMCLQTTLFRRAPIAALRFSPGILLLDQFFFLRLAASATPCNAYYIDERVFEYRIHGEQTTTVTRREALIRDQIALFEGVREIPSAYGPAVRAKLSREYLALAFLEAEAGARRQARAYASRSLRLTRSARSALGAVLIAIAPGAVPFARRMYGRWRSASGRR